MKTLNTIKKTGQGFRRLISLSALPAIGLSVLAYQILGKRCTYRWGNLEVTPLEPISKNEYLFTKVFPSGVVIFGIIIIMSVGYIAGIFS